MFFSVFFLISLFWVKMQVKNPIWSSSLAPTLQNTCSFFKAGLLGILCYLLYSLSFMSWDGLWALISKSFSSTLVLRSSSLFCCGFSFVLQASDLYYIFFNIGIFYLMIRRAIKSQFQHTQDLQSFTEDTSRPHSHSCYVKALDFSWFAFSNIINSSANNLEVISDFRTIKWFFYKDSHVIFMKCKSY